MRGDAQSCPPLPEAQASHGALRFGDSPTSHLLFMLPQELLKPRYDFIFLPQANSESDATLGQASRHDSRHLSPTKGALPRLRKEVLTYLRHSLGARACFLPATGRHT